MSLEKLREYYVDSGKESPSDVASDCIGKTETTETICSDRKSDLAVGKETIKYR